MAETPITVFPIVMDVQEGSLTEHKALHKLTMVRCLRCGKQFQVNEKTAVMLANDLPALRCNNTVYKDIDGVEHLCGYTASVLYYFPKKGGHQFARARHW